MTHAPDCRCHVCLMRRALRESGDYLCVDDIGQYHAIQKPVGDVLVDLGRLWQDPADGDWHLTQEDAEHIHTKYPYAGICDFCSAQPITWTVRCQSFLDAMGTTSVGDWSACTACGDDLRAGRYRALIDRQMQRQASNDARIYRGVLRQIFEQNLQLVLRHRLPYEVEPLVETIRREEADRTRLNGADE